MAEPVFVTDPVEATAVTTGGTAETVIVTSGFITVDTVDKCVTVSGYINLTPGTSAVAAVLKIKRGTTTGGTQVGTTLTSTTIATKLITIPFMAVDYPGESAGLVYSVTLVETSAAANGTVNQAYITALVSE
jgi:hypothetical protein